MNFKIIENGKEIECEILFTFSEKNTNYIVYTDGTKDENDELEIYASRYILNNDQYFLEEIENDYEWDLIDKMIDEKLNKIGE